MSESKEKDGIEQISGDSQGEEGQQVKLNVFSHNYESPIKSFVVGESVPLDAEVNALNHSAFFRVDKPADIKGVIRTALDTQGNALINSEEGGVIFFGVAPSDGKVEGFSLVDKQQEMFIYDSIRNYLKRFDPPVEKESFRVKFIPIEGRPESWVLELLLKTPIKPLLYQNTRGQCFVREKTGTTSGPLSLSTIQTILRKRIQEAQTRQTEATANNSGYPPWVDPYNSFSQNNSGWTAVDDDSDSGCCGCFGKTKKNKKKRSVKHSPSGSISSKSSKSSSIGAKHANSNSLM